jgi:hypothetical protein
LVKGKIKTNRIIVRSYLFIKATHKLELTLQ